MAEDRDSLVCCKGTKELWLIVLGFSGHLGLSLARPEGAIILMYSILLWLRQRTIRLVY
jgi:hypothetical protein